MKGLAVVLVALLAMAGFASPQKFKVKIENEIINFDVAPRQVNGITMVPLRSMVEAMGGTMRWDLQSRTASVVREGRRFDVTLNSLQATTNGKMVQMDEAPIVFQNRLFVPLKYLADATGYVISMEDGWYVLRSTLAKTVKAGGGG